jgi:hypothetical protein
MYELEHLLEQKQIDLDFLCGNGTMTSGGEYTFSKKPNLSLLRSTKEWDNSYAFIKGNLKKI